MTSNFLTVSVNEISFFITHAAIGAGAPLGIAEDFAKDMMWASCCGIDPAVTALSCLKKLDGSPNSGRMSMIEDDASWTFVGSDGLSAVYAGTALTDFWNLESRDGRSLVIKDVDHPLLMAAALAKTESPPSVLEWPNARVTFNDEGEAEISAVKAESALARGPVNIRASNVNKKRDWNVGFLLDASYLVCVARQMVEENISVDATAWAGIVALFRRCLVPSSEQSRMSGAGAGLVDTD